MSKRIKTTAAQFKLYKKYFMEYVGLWGLTEWRYDFALDALDGNSAENIYHLSDRVVSVFLNTTTSADLPFTDALLKETAKHEVHEVLVAELYCLTLTRFINAEEPERARHAIVRRLDRVIK